jgi:hypothetical protein
MSGNFMWQFHFTIVLAFLHSSVFSSINNALPDIVSYFGFHLVDCLLRYASLLKEEQSVKK